MPKWDQYVDEYERDNYRESKRSKVRKPKKLNYKQAKQLKEAKRNGTKYPKKPIYPKKLKR